ncbi:DUF5994 family protein [Streptomyces naphthomycinicus]|uniref:DUF5994 family protein n=1 Tax=Streptomyces naphthomycinicus TaxID=2872625 RepID=UPI001CEDE87F|nr:DUF5994 family protein [Streptomyces sp. TML10]
MEPRRPTESASGADAHTYRMPLPRLTLTPDVSHGPLDGVWWPRCAVLELELPSLADLLEPDPDAAIRVTVDPVEWPDAPHTVMAPGRVITVEPAGPGSEAHVITLDCETVGRWALLVVPPGEQAGTAARLLAAAPENPPGAARAAAPAEPGRPTGATGEAT